jgi:hypothetical protein
MIFLNRIGLDGLRHAVVQLTQHKLRTSLTLLVMVFGVGAVIAMLSIGEELEHESLRLIESMGVRNLEAMGVRDFELMGVRDFTLNPEVVGVHNPKMGVRNLEVMGVRNLHNPLNPKVGGVHNPLVGVRDFELMGVHNLMATSN